MPGHLLRQVGHSRGRLHERIDQHLGLVLKSMAERRHESKANKERLNEEAERRRAAKTPCYPQASAHAARDKRSLPVIGIGV